MSNNFNVFHLLVTPTVMNFGKFSESFQMARVATGTPVLFDTTNNTVTDPHQTARNSIVIYDTFISNYIRKSIKGDESAMGVRSFFIPDADALEKILTSDNPEFEFSAAFSEYSAETIYNTLSRLSVCDAPMQRGRRNVALVVDETGFTFYVSSFVAFNENFATYDVYADDQEINNFILENFHTD